MRRLYIFTILIFFALSATTQNLDNYSLEANYSFASNGTDGTGNYGEVFLKNASFTGGGIYSNGMYNGTDTNGTTIKTPNISGFEAQAFAIQITVKPEASGPILVCGDSWRWLLVKIAGNGNLEVDLSLTNGFAQTVTTSTSALLNQWQTITILFHQESLLLEVYHDGSLAASKIINASLKHNNDFTFSNQNGGLGESYKGFWKDFKMYNSTVTTLTNNSLGQAIHIYPNPASSELIIDSKYDILSTYTVYGIKGNFILKGKIDSDIYRINLGSLRNGSYYIEVSNSTDKRIKKIVVVN